MRATWLSSVLLGAGLEVVELEGWASRGEPLQEIRGVVCHHTATGPSWSDQRVANLLRDGRPDLSGPLAQLGLDRTGRFWVVASGRCNHNGYGKWGNQSIGVEAFNDGVGEPWAEAQVLAWQRGTAALLRRLGFGVAQVLGHKETDPSRKTDPAGLDMAWFRGCVARMLDGRDEDMEAQFVLGLYAGYFGVRPGDPKWDPKGFDHWLKSLLSGALTKDQVRAQFAKAARVG